MQVHLCVYIWMCMHLVWGWRKAPWRAGPCWCFASRVPLLVVILPHPAGHRQWVGLVAATDRFLLWTAFRWSDVEARTALGLHGKLGLGAPVCGRAMNCMDTLSSFQGIAIAAPGVAGTALDSERHLSMCLTCFLLWRFGPVASPDAHLYLPTSELNVLLVYADAVTALWVSDIFFWLSSRFSCCDLDILGCPDHCWVTPLWGKTQAKQPYSWLFKCILPCLSTVGHPCSW